MSTAGRTLIVLGLVILGFVAYELKGTDLAEARSQDRLLEGLRVPAPSPTLQATELTGEPAPPPPPAGEAVARIVIPRIGLDKAVVEGTDLAQLRKGPGHYTGTPLPGQPGNSAIAAHRTTYGAPLFRADELRQGDPILVTTVQGAFRYEVDRVFVVDPTEVGVVAPTSDSILTLTTCEPRFSAKRRLVVVAKLIGKAAPPAPRVVESADPAVLAAPAAPPSTEVVGASGDPAERRPSAIWAGITLVIGLAGSALASRWRRLPAYLLFAAPFLASLWTMYTHLARALPS